MERELGKKKKGGGIARDQLEQICYPISFAQFWSGVDLIAFFL